MFQINVAFAEEMKTVLTRSGEPTNKIKAIFHEIKSLKANDFPKKISSLRLKVKKFINYHKKACQGEFTTLVLNEFSNQRNNKGENELKKLSQNERKLCFRELKNIQTLFVNVVHQARMNYLKAIHKREIESLENLKNQSLRNLDKAFSSI